MKTFGRPVLRSSELCLFTLGVLVLSIVPSASAGIAGNLLAPLGTVVGSAPSEGPVRPGAARGEMSSMEMNHGTSSVAAQPARTGVRYELEDRRLTCVAGCSDQPELLKPGAGTVHDVSVTNIVFTPDSLEIVAGDTVRWTNEGGFHNVEATGLFRCAQGCDGDGMGGNGNASSAAWSFSITFMDQESIDYFCEVHVANGMTGSINVLADPTVFANGFETGSTDEWSSTS